jgi:hypothetical protein
MVLNYYQCFVENLAVLMKLMARINAMADASQRRIEPSTNPSTDKRALHVETIHHNSGFDLNLHWSDHGR